LYTPSYWRDYIAKYPVISLPMSINNNLERKMIILAKKFDDNSIPIKLQKLAQQLGVGLNSIMLYILLKMTAKISKQSQGNLERYYYQFRDIDIIFIMVYIIVLCIELI
jgi:hypothetical protein